MLRCLHARQILSHGQKSTCVYALPVYDLRPTKENSVIGLHDKTHSQLINHNQSL